MKLLHIGDLHIGKNLSGFPLLEDQAYVLEQILGYAQAERPDALLIAGDVYDKQSPSPEAVALFDGFLTRAAALCGAVMLVPGNHDSPERLSFGSRLLTDRGVYITASPMKITLRDTFGDVDFFLIPFTKPSLAEQYLPGGSFDNCQEAFAAVLASLDINDKNRRVAVAHQYFAAPGVERSESEVGYLGGLDSVDAALLAGFHYAALGHLHGPQRAGAEHVRYSGSPLKYSLSEYRHTKSICAVTLGATEAVVTLLPLVPLRDMRRIRGPIEALVAPEVYGQANTQDFLHVTLTDKTEVFDAIGKLRSVYPNILQLTYENTGAAALRADVTDTGPYERKSDFETFRDFYLAQNNDSMTKEQEALIRGYLEGGEGL